MKTQNDIKELAVKIKECSESIELNVGKGTEVLKSASELVNHAMVMVFALGELFSSTSKATNKNPDRIYKRDACGRFAKA